MAVNRTFDSDLDDFLSISTLFLELTCVCNVKILDLFYFNGGRPLVNGGKEVARTFCAIKNSQMSDLDDFLGLSMLFGNDTCLEC